MTNTVNQVAERLASPATGIDPDLWVPLLRLLAQGQPVELATLATASVKTMPEVIRALASPVGRQS